MGTIIAMGLVAIAGLMAVSQYFAYAPVAVSNKSRMRYMVLAFSVAAMTVVALVLDIIYPNSFGFILYALDRFLRVLVMGETIFLTEDMVDVDKKYISTFITAVSYSAVTLFFIDSMMQGGQLSVSMFGVYFPQDAHAPCISSDKTRLVKKAVFKILYE